MAKQCMCEQPGVKCPIHDMGDQFPAYGHPVPDATPDLEGLRVAERDARMGAYRDRERRRAARALDDYLARLYGEPTEQWAVAQVMAERFIEQVGDYVLSRLHNNGHYGVSEILDPGGDRGLCQHCGQWVYRAGRLWRHDRTNRAECPNGVMKADPGHAHAEHRSPDYVAHPQPVDNDRFPSADDVQEERFR